MRHDNVAPPTCTTTISASPIAAASPPSPTTTQRSQSTASAAPTTTWPRGCPRSHPAPGAPGAEIVPVEGRLDDDHVGRPLEHRVVDRDGLERRERPRHRRRERPRAGT